MRGKKTLCQSEQELDCMGTEFLGPYSESEEELLEVSEQGSS